MGYVGIDVSKNKLDISIFSSGKDLRKFSHTVVDNNKDGFKAMLRWLSDNHVVLKGCCFAMEHTGFYSDALERFLAGKKYHYVMLPTNVITHYPLYTKVKTDKLDAAKLADYSARFSDQITYTHLPSKTMRKLRELDKDRKFFVQQRTDCLNAIQTIKGKERRKPYQDLIDRLTKDIDKKEEEMLELIKTDEKLMKNYLLLTSIPGIGIVNAVNIIVITRNFEAFDTARQLAKYMGVAPSTHTSGKSVHWRGRPYGHYDGQAKADLLCAARRAVNQGINIEVTELYTRKTKGKEGNKDVRRIAINAVTNELLHQAFAIVKRGTPYEVRRSA